MLRILLVSAIGVLPAARAWAVDVTPTGFLVRHELAIGAPAARVYASLLDVGSWWSDNHTYSGESRNLSIDARAGGCFCEKLPNGAVEHMRVVFLRPNEVLRMDGALVAHGERHEGGPYLQRGRLHGGRLRSDRAGCRDRAEGTGRPLEALRRDRCARGEVTYMPLKR